jgi:CBS domain-containing protein
MRQTFDGDQRQSTAPRTSCGRNVEKRPMSITAADIMTSPAVFVTPQTNMAEIASLLASKHYSAVPVCHPDGTLAGIVSEGDILKPFRESVRARRDWWLGVIAEGEELPQDFLDYIRRDTRTAADVMVRQVFTAEEDTTLPELAEVMINHGVKRLPVLRDGKVAGIVSRADLIAAIARSPAMLV